MLLRGNAMPKSIKIILAIIVLVFLFSVGTYLYFNLNGNPFEKRKLKQEVEEYLNNNYDVTMEIVNVDYSFTSGTYFVDAITVDEPKITFRVSKNSVGDFVDSYLISYWDYSVSNEISNYASDIFSKTCEGDILFTEGSPIKNDNLKLNEVPDFLTIRDKFKAAIFSFVKIDSNFNVGNKEEEFNNVYQVAKYIFDKYQFKSVEFVYLDNTNITLSLEDYNNLGETIEIENYMK